MHANRQYTSKTPVIPQVDADKYPGLVSMTVTGEYIVSEALEAAIKGQKEKLENEKQRRAAAKAKEKSLTKRASQRAGRGVGADKRRRTA